MIIYRGINQKIAWISLSSVYQPTGIPSSQVPADLTLPTTPTTLAKAKQTVQTIKRTNICELAVKKQASWVAHKPKPPAKKPASSKKKGSRHTTIVVKPYPPEPALPGYCRALGFG